MPAFQMLNPKIPNTHLFSVTFRLSKKALLSSGNRDYRAKIITKGNLGVLLRGKIEEIYP